MRFGRILAAAAVSAALASSPVIAADAVSAPSVASSARAGADMNDESDIHGGFIIPLLVIAAVIAAVIVIADNGDNAPSSP